MEEWKVVWLSDVNREKDYAVDFLSLSMHDVSRDPEAYPSPCIYTHVNPSTGCLVYVTSNRDEFPVVLDKRTCTCNVFQMDELPCAHALAHIKKFHCLLMITVHSIIRRKKW